MKPSTARAEQKRKPGVRAEALRGVAVLIVDDNADTRAILAMWFEHLGCVVVTAESADEALFMCRLARPDIVLTDISMPNHDGYWLLRSLRTVDESSQQPPIPVVAMTAFRAMRDVPSVSASFDAWVSKPIILPDLSALVERLTKRRRAA